MSKYMNEQIDEILPELYHEAFIHGSTSIEKDASTPIREAKQALTSLIKELVAEAKPARAVISDDEMGIDRARKSAANHAIDEFEQNLLKVLEERE